mgnify:CR=1 FL=1
MNSRGFTLIEVLISLLVLAIGVLGIAALQMSTYKQLITSHNYGTAMMLAGEIGDRMMANRAQSLANAYNHTSYSGTPPACNTTTCTAAEVAVYDVATWQTRVTGNIASGTRTPGSLPSGTGSVARQAGTDNFLITVRWDDDLSGSSGTNCPVQSAADLDCYTLLVSF